MSVNCSNCGWGINEQRITCQKKDAKLGTLQCPDNCVGYTDNYFNGEENLKGYLESIGNKDFKDITKETIGKWVGKGDDLYNADININDTNLYDIKNILKDTIYFEDTSDKPCGKLPEWKDNVKDRQSIHNGSHLLPKVSDIKQYIINSTKTTATISADINRKYQLLDLDVKTGGLSEWPCCGENDGDCDVYKSPFTDKKTCNPDKTYYSEVDLMREFNRVCLINGSGICNEKEQKDSISDGIKQKIRNYTLEKIPSLKKTHKFTSSPVEPPLIPLEIEMWASQFTESRPEDLDDLKDINYLQVFPEEYKLLTTAFIENQKFRGCVDDLLMTGENDREMIDFLSKHSMKDYDEPHFNYIKAKIDKIIALRPNEINSCLQILSYIEVNICKGGFVLSILDIFGLILNLIGIKVDLYKVKKDTTEYNNLMKLMNIVIPQMSTIMRRVLDLSIYFEKKYCNGETTMTTHLLRKTYDELFDSSADIQYKLFDKFNMNLDFFNDFNKTFYGRIIILIFIAFIIVQIRLLYQ